MSGPFGPPGRENTITTFAFHVPPRPSSALKTTWGGPPEISILSSFPGTKKPIDRLSRDQKGKEAPSVPSIGRAVRESSGRTQSFSLPAGDYNLYYGHLFVAGTYVVEVASKAEGGPHGFIKVQAKNPTSTTKSAPVCTRQGDSGIVRELQMSAIGETVYFALPHGVKASAY